MYELAWFGSQNKKKITHDIYTKSADSVVQLHFPLKMFDL